MSKYVEHFNEINSFIFLNCGRCHRSEILSAVSEPVQTKVHGKKTTRKTVKKTAAIISTSKTTTIKVNLNRIEPKRRNGEEISKQTNSIVGSRQELNV